MPNHDNHHWKRLKISSSSVPGPPAGWAKSWLSIGSGAKPRRRRARDASAAVIRLTPFGLSWLLQSSHRCSCTNTGSPVSAKVVAIRQICPSSKWGHGALKLSAPLWVFGAFATVGSDGCIASSAHVAVVVAGRVHA